MFQSLLFRRQTSLTMLRAIYLSQNHKLLWDKFFFIPGNLWPSHNVWKCTIFICGFSPIDVPHWKSAAKILNFPTLITISTDNFSATEIKNAAPEGQLEATISLNTPARYITFFGNGPDCSNWNIGISHCHLLLQFSAPLPNYYETYSCLTHAHTVNYKPYRLIIYRSTHVTVGTLLLTQEFFKYELACRA